MFNLPTDFANTLQGRTCFVSRVKKNTNLCAEYPLFTLHQIVYKVLKKSPAETYYTNRLAGEFTFSNVENALITVNHSHPDPTKIKKVYYQIRSHKNQITDIQKTIEYKKYLQKYQEFLGDQMDWDDSMQTATWMLNQGNVSSLYKFPYDNIVLVQPELLNLPTNKNAKDFFLSWCEWISNYTKWNVYSIDKNGIAQKYNNGSFVPYKQHSTQSAVFSFSKKF